MTVTQDETDCHLRDPLELEPLVASVQRELKVRHLEREGFYERRERNWGGEFFGPRYLTRWSGTRTPGIVARAVGGRVARARPARSYQLRFPRKRCAAVVYVDGRPNGPFVPDFPSSEVAAVEAYRGPSDGIDAPVIEVSRCGAVFIWTWTGPNPSTTWIREKRLPAANVPPPRL